MADSIQENEELVDDEQQPETTDEQLNEIAEENALEDVNAADAPINEEPTEAPEGEAQVVETAEDEQPAVDGEQTVDGEQAVEGEQAVDGGDGVTTEQVEGENLEDVQEGESTEGGNAEVNVEAGNEEENAENPDGAENTDGKEATENGEEKEPDSTENTDETQEKKEEDVVPVKKEVKRKAREKKFDENLILEEDDEEQLEEKAASPGPPQMEPIGQNLDETDRLNLNIHGDFNREALGATTPDRGDATLDEEFMEIETEIKPTREEIIERYKAIVEERDKLQNTNNQLHHKLADYYRKRKSEEAQNQPLFDKSSQEQEQRYLKYLSTIEGLRKQLERERWEAEKEMEDLKEKCEMKQNWVNEDRIRFNKAKREAAQKSVSIYSGKTPSNKEIDSYMQRENQKELEVINVRLENIKLKNQLKKKEMELKAKEELGEGLHMIDFEQLKIENQTYNEKIEERNEELMKLKKKINNTVQILSHVKEKLQFVYVENDKEKLNLAVYDEQVKKNRDVLNRIKQSRDSLRVDNARLKQNSGLLGNTVLLRDFEECVDLNDNLESKIEFLKRKHAELILNNKGVKQKISQTKGN